MEALKKITLYILSIPLIFLTNLAFSQDATIKIGNNQIAVNEYFSITITLNNEQIKSYSNFPDIPGFQKRGVSSSSSTNIVNGQISFSISYTQNYAPTKEGKFKLPAFTMEINGKKIQSSGTVITVGPAKQQQDDPFDNDPFADFFGGRGGPKEYMDVKEDAFFALTTTKDKVYVGEGFTATLAFYVAENNRAEMQFYDLQNQLMSLIKKIKPANCLEENFNIEEIQPEQVMIDGKKYMEYKLFRAAYYPINKEPVKFPALSMKMIKYKVAKVPSFFGFNNKKQDFKDFFTKPKTIIVKDLPPHPLKENVAVGVYKLEESINSRKFTTGKSINYNFKITGEGNIMAIQKPIVNENKNFDIYPPNIYQDIKKNGVSVTGSKNFNFFLIPKEPGDYKLNELLSWIYFNPKTSKYDTLKPRITLNVKGESSKNLAVGANDYGEFTDLMENYDNNFISPEKDTYIKWLTNAFLAGIFALTLVVLFKK